jgi:hypothetical protein
VAVVYEQEIGHVQSAAHAALLAQLEAGAELPLELLHPMGQRATGQNVQAS